MKRKYLSLLFLLLITLIGCSLSTQDKAIIAANEVHQIALLEASIIDNFCVPKYQSSKSLEDINNVDKICLPAQASYYLVKASWETLITVIINSKQKKASILQVEAAVWKLFDALADFKKKIEEIK